MFTANRCYNKKKNVSFNFKFSKTHALTEINAFYVITQNVNFDI